jgi:solute carrier family 25 (mitochondrial thiamine pyrophosphate transporter), member 19
VKIRLQLQSHSLSGTLSHADLHGSPIYKGTFSTLKNIIANEGVTALWKGNVPAEVMYICYSAAQFSAYRSTTLALQQIFGEDTLPHSVQSFVAGAAAGAAATMATYPLDLLRTRFAAQGNERVYASLRRALVEIYRDEGPRGFFRGLAPGVGQIVPYMGVFFAVYESLRLRMGALNMPWGGGDATAGIIASIISKTTVFPLDLVRKRMQVQGPTRGRYIHKNIPEYRSTLGALRMIARNEGVRGLYRGLTVSLVKAAPGSALTVWTYERVLQFLIGREMKAGGERQSI